MTLRLTFTPHAPPHYSSISQRSDEVNDEYEGDHPTYHLCKAQRTLLLFFSSLSRKAMSILPRAFCPIRS